MQRQSCGRACTSAGTMISSTTSVFAGMRGWLDLRGDDGTVERRGSSSATGSADFGGSMIPLSNICNSAGSSFSLCAPKSRLSS
jgi:hypothetical protein